MTFEEFQATGADAPNLGFAVNDDVVDLIGGRVYFGNLYIEDATTWKPADRAKLPATFGRWYLRIASGEYHGDDLRALELKLYAFALSEQIVYPTPTRTTTLAAAMREAERVHTGSISWDHFDARRLAETMVRLVDDASSKLVKTNRTETDATTGEQRGVTVTDWLNATDRAFIEAMRERLAADKKEGDS